VSKINWRRVLASAIGVFAVSFVSTAAHLPAALAAADWSTAKAAAVSGALAGIAAVVEAAFHAFTSGWGDPTSPK
jgi:hypothetical protein